MQQLLGPCSTACAPTSATTTLLLRHRVRQGCWAQAAAAVSHHHRRHYLLGHCAAAAVSILALPLAAVADSRAGSSIGSSSRCPCLAAAAAAPRRTRTITNATAANRAFSGAGASTSTPARAAVVLPSSGARKISTTSSGGRICASGGPFRAMRKSVAAKAGGSGGGGGSDSGSGFWTLQGYVLYESEVKKSKFVVHAWPASSAAEALSLIRAASDPSASHNCFAYRVGLESRCSDDGEPGGTAGRPIAGAIEGEGLDRVAVLVTRYFGGIKLGAGGLVRAYGGAAKECLRLAPRVFAKAQAEVVVEVSYDELGTVYGCLDMHGCVRLAEEYGRSGTVAIHARVDADRLDSLRTAVTDGTGGRRCVELAESLAEAA